MKFSWWNELFKSHKSQFIFGALLTENDTRISDKEGSQTDVGIVKLLADLTKDSEFYCRLYSVENFNTKADLVKISLKTSLSEKDVKF